MIFHWFAGFLTIWLLSNSPLRYSPTRERASSCPPPTLPTAEISHWIRSLATSLKSESYLPKEPERASRKIKPAETVSLRYPKTMTKVSAVLDGWNVLYNSGNKALESSTFIENSSSSSNNLMNQQFAILMETLCNKQIYKQTNNISRYSWKGL